MVVAGSTLQERNSDGARIGDEELEETNPLAIVPSNNPTPSPQRSTGRATVEEVSLHRVRKEEVESKLLAWQTAKIAKINNRFTREDAVIKGRESERVEKATTRLKKAERKLGEQRARAIEKMQNDVAKTRWKAEEKRASAEAKRGTKVARILELANFLRVVGRAPSRRSFF